MTNTGKTLDDFEVEQSVTYIPNHADNDINHSDCERGRVSSKNDEFVFVRFPGYTNGHACDPTNLT